MEFHTTKIQPRTITVVDQGVMFEVAFDVIEDGCPKCRGTWMKHTPEDITPEPLDQSDCSCDVEPTPVRESCDCDRGQVKGSGPLVVMSVFQFQGKVSPVVIVHKQ